MNEEQRELIAEEKRRREQQRALQPNTSMRGTEPDTRHHVPVAVPVFPDQARVPVVQAYEIEDPDIVKMFRTAAEKTSSATVTDSTNQNEHCLEDREHTATLVRDCSNKMIPKEFFATNMPGDPTSKQLMKTRYCEDFYKFQGLAGGPLYRCTSPEAKENPSRTDVTRCDVENRKVCVKGTAVRTKMDDLFAKGDFATPDAAQPTLAPNIRDGSHQRPPSPWLHGGGGGNGDVTVGDILFWNMYFQHSLGGGGLVNNVDGGGGSTNGTTEGLDATGGGTGEGLHAIGGATDGVSDATSTGGGGDGTSSSGGDGGGNSSDGSGDSSDGTSF